MHRVIQLAMGWDDSHLHAFRPGPDKRDDFAFFLTEYDDHRDGINEWEVRLDQVLREVGDRLFYTYDFGDSWHHTIEVESLRPAADDDPAAVCLTGRRAGPEEDVGGIGTHNDIVASLAEDPSRAGLPEWLDEWLPEDYDPTAFEVERVNRLLVPLR